MMRPAARDVVTTLCFPLHKTKTMAAGPDHQWRLKQTVLFLLRKKMPEDPQIQSMPAVNEMWFPWFHFHDVYEEGRTHSMFLIMLIRVKFGLFYATIRLALL